MHRIFADEGLRRVRLLACLALLATLAACGGSHTYRSTAHYNPHRYYPPPGPASDPWGPYIHEASGRFGVPENWIRRVMHQESGGQEDVISWAGAMGLMQVMPDTYDGLRERYNLGADPFDPHNNILAGTAYLREMYDRYGAPGFLAAYNAGPNRVDRYLSSGAPLPSETVDYVASIAPLLGAGTPMSGPLAVYAGGATVTRVAYHPTPSGCDPDAAYNPDGPCTKLRPAVTTAVAVTSAPMAATPYAQACDPDAAYDPERPCRKLRPAVTSAVAVTAAPVAAAPYAEAGPCDPDAAYDPERPCRPQARPAVMVQGLAPLGTPLATPPAAPLATPRAYTSPTMRYATESRPIQERMGQPVAFPSNHMPGRWMIQVGAFATLSAAQNAAERARAEAPDLLRMTNIELPATAPLGTQVAFRARLSGLPASAAAEACSRLTSLGMACITLPPPRDSF